MELLLRTAWFDQKQLTLRLSDESSRAIEKQLSLPKGFLADKGPERKSADLEVGVE